MSSKPLTQTRARRKVSAQDNECLPAALDSLRHLKDEIRRGRPWHLALLETAGGWAPPLEDHNGRTYHYLLAGEAFDWLLLAERLCSELDGMVPDEEREQLLFHGKLPQEVDATQLEKLLGVTKYQAYMNYWYGVVVEEALQLAMEEIVRKEHRSSGRSEGDQIEDIAWTRLYNGTRPNLLRHFRQHTGLPETDYLTLAQVKEFTYWLFKRRVAIWDPARVASDTHKALERLDTLRGK